MRQWVYDYETICNCFVAIFKLRNEDDIRIFVVHPDFKDDQYDLMKFLKKCIEDNDTFLGFNNLNFDAQVTELILDMGIEDPLTFVKKVYSFVDENIIKRTEPYPYYRVKDLRIHNLDIFRLNGWNTSAKSCSLKWMQFGIDWENIEEMPLPFNENITSQEQIDTIVNYCLNDVLSTEAGFNLTDSKGVAVMDDNFKIRDQLSRNYGLYLYSAPEPKLASEIFAYYLSKMLKVSSYSLKQINTKRNYVCIKDFLLPNIRFRTEEFGSVLDNYQKMIVDMNFLRDPRNKNASEKYHYEVVYKGVTFAYGIGGAHACIKSGIYQSERGYIIKSFDVKSYYPNLSIKNGFHPAHLDKRIFCDLYESLYKKRNEYPKGSALNYLFKIVLNSSYGLSLEPNSFLYDPLMSFSITITGQLLLTMLLERLSTEIPDSQPLMMNTDGGEIMIPIEYEDKFREICKEWEHETKLTLEYADYSKMIISDVNSYIAVNIEGSAKCKGRFEFEDRGLHKNKSATIVQKALYEYFIKGVHPEEYLKLNNNIFDYVIGIRLKEGAHFEEVSVEDGIVVNTKHKKIIRFLVTKTGSKLFKHFAKGTKSQIIAGKYKQTICNNLHEVSKDTIMKELDRSYYLRLINQEIRDIETNTFSLSKTDKSINTNVQLKLF